MSISTDKKKAVPTRPLHAAHRLPRRAGHRAHPRPHRHLRPLGPPGLRRFPFYGPKLPRGRGLAGIHGRFDGRMAALLSPAAGGRRLGRHRAAGGGAVGQRHRLRADHPRCGVLAALASPGALADTGRQRGHSNFSSLERTRVSRHERAALRPVYAPRLDAIGGLPPAR